jgi:acyl carrier protein
MTADAAAPAAVLDEIRRILERVRDGCGSLDGTEITRDTTFQEDLELESIDLVELAAQLDARYGSEVNFADFLAGLELEEIIELTVGRLVDHIVACLEG